MKYHCTRSRATFRSRSRLYSLILQAEDALIGGANTQLEDMKSGRAGLDTTQQVIDSSGNAGAASFLRRIILGGLYFPILICSSKLLMP
jgi:hypothetical protein